MTGCSSGIGEATAAAPGRAPGGPSTRPPAAPETLAGLAAARLPDARARRDRRGVHGGRGRRGRGGRGRRRRARQQRGLQPVGRGRDGADGATSAASSRRTCSASCGMCQLVLPGMRAQGWGRIVNVSSMGGRLTFPGGGLYHGYQARRRGDLRRAALRGGGLRRPRRRRRARHHPHRASARRRSRRSAAAADGPYAAFNRAVAQATRGRLRARPARPPRRLAGRRRAPDRGDPALAAAALPLPRHGVGARHVDRCGVCFRTLPGMPCCTIASPRRNRHPARR